MTKPLVLPPPPLRAGEGGPRSMGWPHRLRRVGGRLAAGLVVALALGAAALAAVPAVDGRVLIITSGSMAPTIATGDAVVLLDTPPASIASGDVIAYHGYGTDRLVTHRVVSRHDVDGAVHFRTQGDANAQPDPNLPPAAGLAGEVAFVLPGAGRLLLAVTSDGAQLGLAGLAVVLAGLEARRLLGQAPACRRRHAAQRPWPIPRGRAAHQRPARLAGILLVGCVGLASLGAGNVADAEALLASTSTVADNSLATLDVVAPGNVSATFDCGTLGLGKGIVVDWDAVSGAEGYEVARSTESGGPYSTIASVDAATTEYMDNDVNNNTTYYYVVRTTASGWASENSTEVSETTPGSTDCLL